MMNYLVPIILSILFLIIGWVLGYNKASSQWEHIDEAELFLEENSNLLKIGMFQEGSARGNITLLQHLERNEVDLATEHVVDELGRFYEVAKESVDDGMATPEEAAIVGEIDKKAKDSALFRTVTEHEE